MSLEVEFKGITKEDIQGIFENVVKEYNCKIGLLFLDVSYLYTFDVNDFAEVKHFNMLGRYDLNAIKEWHRYLEHWYNDHSVILGGHSIKPIKISRSFDRVVNEGLEMIAGCVTGEDGANFPFRSIGDGTASAALPSDTILGHEIDRINVNETPEGGSMAKDGTTIYSIGNHSKTVETPANGEFTECGIHDTDSDTTDMMLDHSIFDDPVPHTQNSDAPGSTTVIYMCST